MTTWMSGVCKANGINIHYLRTGGCKPPVVLLHGLTGSGACWIPLARALEGEYDVVMPDARGHGNSSAPLDGYRYENHASDVISLIQELGLAAPVLLGHSMGGMTAAVVASEMAKSIRGVILADPTFLSPQRQREVYESDVVEQHRRLLSLGKGDVLAQARVQHPHRSPEFIELLAEARLQTQVRAFDVLVPPNPEYHDLVSAIHVPILLVVGDNGAVVSLETARELQKLTPRLRVEQIRDAGHGLPYDQRIRFEAVVRSFLQSVAAAAHPCQVLQPHALQPTVRAIGVGESRVGMGADRLFPPEYNQRNVRQVDLNLHSRWKLMDTGTRSLSQNSHSSAQSSELRLDNGSQW